MAEKEGIPRIFLHKHAREARQTQKDKNQGTDTQRHIYTGTYKSLRHRDIQGRDTQWHASGPIYINQGQGQQGLEDDRSPPRGSINVHYYLGTLLLYSHQLNYIDL